MNLDVIKGAKENTVSSLRVYFKGEGVETKGASRCLILENGHSQWVQIDERGFFVRVDIHAGQCVIHPKIAKQIELVTIEERITDQQVCYSVAQGLYRRGSTRAHVIGSRQVDHDFTSGQIEVEYGITIEVSARSPKAAIRMFTDILAGAIKPIRPYGLTPQKSTGDDNIED